MSYVTGSHNVKVGMSLQRGSFHAQRQQPRQPAIATTRTLDQSPLFVDDHVPAGRVDETG